MKKEPLMPLASGRPRKKISTDEKKLADFMAEHDISAVRAARKVWKIKCEPGSAQMKRVKQIAQSRRFKEYLEKAKMKEEKAIVSSNLLQAAADIEIEDIRKHAFEALLGIRDNPDANASVRFRAIQALEKLSDPSNDVNLIYMWLDILYRGAMAHCPRCHTTFPLWNIKNQKLEDWRKEVEADEVATPDGIYERRKEILKRADTRKEPHVGQVACLDSPERHVVGLGAARAGKSFLLAMFGLLGLLVPGVEIWLLARIYKDAASEAEYLEKFLNTLFFPYTRHVVRKLYDSKTEELTLETKWGSVLKIKSAKSKGSITGRELEFALVAEPGWVPDDVFNGLRARMSSRLGRMIMLGTPQGFGGILNRMINMTGRDPKTKKVIRIPLEQRLMKNGSDWGISLLKTAITPDQNPEYVKSELDNARMELVDSEYASEFEGLQVSAEGAKFPHVTPKHLINLPRARFDDCAFVLGIDQGPKNFAGCLLSYDGDTISVVREYFDNDARTMKSKMRDLMHQVGVDIKKAGGNPADWVLTIFDADPPLHNELEEFEAEGKEWPTDVVFRPKSLRGQFNQDNWRKETYEFINVQSMEPNIKLWFDMEHCDLLADQMMQAQTMPENRDIESGSTPNAKGWIINDPWRGDHVVDAFVLAMYTILSGQVILQDAPTKMGDPFEEQQAAFRYRIAASERDELRGYDGDRRSRKDVFQEEFGRPAANTTSWGVKSYYQDY